MVKTPFLVAGAVILAVIAGVAYVELQPAPVAVKPAPAAPPQAAAPESPAVTATPQPPADCLLPGPPPVPPDGGKATAGDMKLAHDVIQSFVVSLESYQTCREHQFATASANVTAEQKLRWRDQGNAAVDEANALAGAFSAQLKIYHTKHPEPLAQTPSK